MATLQIVETSLRDGNQCLWGALGIDTARTLTVAPLMERVGYRALYLSGGGVAANSRLRAMAEERACAKGIRVRVPRPGLCTDYGAMVAALGSEMVARGRHPSALDLPADSSMPITEVVA